MGLKQFFELAERLFRIWVGTAWGKGALALIVGGVLSITSIVQYIIPPVAKVFGVTITIPETPIWLSLTLISLGILLLVLSRLLPDWSEQVPPAEPQNPLRRHQIPIVGQQPYVMRISPAFRLPPIDCGSLKK